MTQGVTPYWHQVRDQAAHIGLGTAVGLVAAGPLLGAAGAAAIGSVREVFQWYGIGGEEKLNSPSLGDSLTDASFVAIGGACGAALIIDWRVGLAAYAVAIGWALGLSRLVSKG